MLDYVETIDTGNNYNDPNLWVGRITIDGNTVFELREPIRPYSTSAEEREGRTWREFTDRLRQLLGS